MARKRDSPIRRQRDHGEGLAPPETFAEIRAAGEALDDVRVRLEEQAVPSLEELRWAVARVEEWTDR